MITTEGRSEIFRAKMNFETAQIGWKELQRFFANGAAIAVSAELDLVDVASHISEDNAAKVEQWLISGQLGKVTDEQAKAWFESDASLGDGGQPLRAGADGGTPAITGER